MADRSKIEWTDATWNPIRARHLAPVNDAGDFDPSVGWHCEHVSEGCRNCYAEVINRRLGTGLDFKPGHRRDLDIFLDEEMLLRPLKWKKPRLIFVGSMTDLFADFVSDDWLHRIFAVMALCPQHTFQLLTKRPERMRAYLSEVRPVRRIADLVMDLRRSDLARKRGMGPSAIGPLPHLPPGRAWWPLTNVWLGTSVEDQAAAEARIPALLATPAAIRFLSCEPLIGPVDLTEVCNGWYFQNPLTGHRYHDAPEGVYSASDKAGVTLDWVIVGGESGASARPMHPDWARSLRDQCAAAGVAFTFKQWGEWAPGEIATHTLRWPKVRTADWFDDRWTFDEVRGDTEFTADDEPTVYRGGKKRNGRLLDGVAHDGRPA